jgi:hypothetical protein
MSSEGSRHEFSHLIDDAVLRRHAVTFGNENRLRKLCTVFAGRSRQPLNLKWGRQNPNRAHNSERSPRTFDGNGNLTQTDNIHGSITGLATPNRAGTGTYTINADCTGTMKLINTDAPPLTVAIVVVDDGSEVRAAVMDPTAIVTAGTTPPQVMVTSNSRRVVTRGVTCAGR